ncbi:MAG: purine-binding chemotaxis protein CheW [Nitrospirae bacterium]|nr:MAG: purine-binding chemotaxis protein CheW [Nitrospirota bacterium]
MPEQTAAQEVFQTVTFWLGSEEYGINILNVQEIIKPTEITVVPNSPTHIEGVINLRGRVIPVINLRKKFLLQGQEGTTSTKIMVVEANGKTVGLLVDRVNEVLRINPETIEPPPALTPANHAEYISGVCKMPGRLVIVLDLEQLISETG